MEGIINVISDSNYRSKFLDALYDLRTSLAIKRILNKTIPVSKFKEMLVTVKSNYDDKNIYIMLYKDKYVFNYEGEAIPYIIGSIIIAILVLTVIIVLRKKSKKNNNV